MQSIGMRWVLAVSATLSLNVGDVLGQDQFETYAPGAGMGSSANAPYSVNAPAHGYGEGGGFGESIGYGEGAAAAAFPHGAIEDYQVDWAVQLEALFLYRSRSDGIPLAGDANGTFGEPMDDIPLLNAGDLRFNFEPGWRIGVGRALDSRRSVEFYYFGIQEWETGRAIAGNDNLDVPFPFAAAGFPPGVVDFMGADMVSARYSSDLHNFESNLRFLLETNTSVLAGVRYLNMDEDFTLLANDIGGANDGLPSPYRIGTENDLIGLQLGGNHRMEITNRLSFDFDALGGVYLNFTEQNTLWLDEGGVIVRNFNADSEVSSFVGELRFNAVYQFSPSLALRAGYQLMWVEGVSLAPEQMDYALTPTAGSDLHHNGHVYYHGATIGLEYVR